MYPAMERQFELIIFGVVASASSFINSIFIFDYDLSYLSYTPKKTHMLSFMIKPHRNLC